MNKYFDVFFLLFVFIFTTSIDSFPHRDLFKRKDEMVGKLLQCPGDFPTTFTGFTYTPEVFVPGQNFTEHFKWTTTIDIVKGSIGVIEVYRKNDLLYTHETDFCEVIEKFGYKCPIPPGTYEMEFTLPFLTSPDQPKDVTDEYLTIRTCKLS